MQKEKHQSADKIMTIMEFTEQVEQLHEKYPHDCQEKREALTLLGFEQALVFMARFHRNKYADFINFLVDLFHEGLWPKNNNDTDMMRSIGRCFMKMCKIVENYESEAKLFYAPEEECVA